MGCPRKLLSRIPHYWISPRISYTQLIQLSFIVKGEKRTQGLILLLLSQFSCKSEERCLFFVTKTSDDYNSTTPFAEVWSQVKWRVWILFEENSSELQVLEGQFSTKKIIMWSHHKSSKLQHLSCHGVLFLPDTSGWSISSRLSCR